MTSRDFLRAATQRLTTAHFLSTHRYNIDASYLAGYAIECALKALILDSTAPSDREAMLKTITSGKRMHNYEVLGDILKRLGRPIPLVLAIRFRRWHWSTDLRYEYGRGNTSETKGFLRTAGLAYDWVKGHFP
jgi:HEPN domain-containing protein